MKKAIQLDNKIGNFLQLCDGYMKGLSVGGNIPEAETIQKCVYHSFLYSLVPVSFRVLYI